MQVPTGQIQTGPAFAKAIGATQRPGIAETPNRAARPDEPAQASAKVEAPTRHHGSEPRNAAPEGGGQDRALPRGSVVDISV